VLRADLPGISESDVKIELDDNVLRISGERKSEQEERKQGYYRIERSSGAFSRSLTLPEGVDADAVKATFDQGVLEVRVPKPEARKPRKVEISVGSAPKTIEGTDTEQ
jgi:HSP20 family protein